MNTPACDDLNPCTSDSSADGQCQHSPRPNGTACDDGDFCTLGDVCVSGACAAGVESAGPVEPLGRTQGFGSQGVVGTGTGRYLFYESINDRVRVSLVELEGDSSTVLDHETLESVSFLDNHHASVPVAALDGGLVVMGGEFSPSIVLLDVSGDDIDVLSEFSLPWAFESPHPRSFARQGDRLWVCATTFFSGGSLYQLDISNPSAPTVVAEHEAPECGSMAASAEGDALYVNTTSGVYPLDTSHIDDDGTFDVGDVMAPSAGLAISGTYLMLRESQQVRVLYEADRSEAFTLPIATHGASLSGDRLFLQGDRAAGARIESFLSVYDIAGDAPQLLDEVVVASDTDVPAWASGASLRLATDAEHAIHYQTKRVYQLVDDELREMTVPGLGSLKYLAGDGEHALAIEKTRTQAFNVTDPTSPRSTSTRNYLDDQLYHVAPVLYESIEPQQVHFGFSDESDQIELLTTTFNSLTLQRRSLDAELHQEVGSFQVSGARSTNALFEGDTLYQLVRPTRGSTLTRLLRFPASQLPSDGSAIGEPVDVLELTPAAPWSTEGDYPTAIYDVDARAQRAVVAISVQNASARGGFVYWIDLSTSPPTVLDWQELPSNARDVRVSGERLVLALEEAACCGSSWLAMWERGSAMVSFRGREDIPARNLSFIAFDGRAAYARGMYFDERDEKVIGLAVVPWRETAKAAFVPMQAEPTSVATTPYGVVVGSVNELVTIKPYCGN